MLYFNAHSIFKKVVSASCSLEEWLADETPDSFLSFNSSFSVIRCDRDCAVKGRGGWVLILVWHVDAILTGSKSVSSGCKFFCFGVLCNSKFRSFSVYHPPDTRELLDCILDFCVVDKAAMTVDSLGFPLTAPTDHSSQSRNLLDTFVRQAINLVSSATQ